jgi:hypothetical protein
MHTEFFVQKFVKRIRKWDYSTEINFRDIVCCENGKWKEVAMDRVQWRALVLTVKVSDDGA